MAGKSYRVWVTVDLRWRRAESLGLIPSFHWRTYSVCDHVWAARQQVGRGASVGKYSSSDLLRLPELVSIAALLNAGMLIRRAVRYVI